MIVNLLSNLFLYLSREYSHWLWPLSKQLRQWKCMLCVVMINPLIIQYSNNTIGHGEWLKHWHQMVALSIKPHTHPVCISQPRRRSVKSNFWILEMIYGSVLEGCLRQLPAECWKAWRYDVSKGLCVCVCVSVRAGVCACMCAAHHLWCPVQYL
jgi:hypothetical protein